MKIYITPGNLKEKRQKHSPFEGVEGVQRKREESKLFMACTKIGTFLFGEFNFCVYLCPQKKDYGSIEFYIKRISEPAGSRVRLGRPGRKDCYSQK